MYSPFRWEGTGQTNSTSYNCSSGNYRTVFIAWPLEGLASLEDRVEVIGSVVNWFGGCVVPPTETLTPTEMVTPTPTITPSGATVTPTATPASYIYLPLILERG